MAWIDAVSVLVLLQYVWFASLVGQARGRYQVPAPAVSGHEMFERIYRVQMNTLELMVVLLPALWMAARYWSPVWMSAIAAVYLVGRIIYWRAYAHDPRSRTLGFALSFTPVVLLLIAVIAGVVRSALQ